MEDVRNAARERAARTKSAPVGTSFETERQRSKNALVKQIRSQDGRNVHIIAAATDAPQEDRILRVAAYCRASTDPTLHEKDPGESELEIRRLLR